MARIVLVADDSPTIQKKALGILKGEGFDVETVSNGVAAIKRLAVLRPVVILADVSMPGRDGYEVCEFVRKSAELSRVPVFLVASDMEPYDDARGAEVRADGIIKKPFEPRELVSLVVKFAERFEALTPTITLPPLPAPRRERTHEFAISIEDSNEAPTVAENVAPDFFAASEGIAFADPTGEEAPEYSSESQPAETDVESSAPQAEAEVAVDPAPAPEWVNTAPAPEPQTASETESSFAVGELPASNSFDPLLLSPFAEPIPSFPDGPEAAIPEPVFIEEQPALTSERVIPAQEIHTTIFRAPEEIAEPVWNDETLPPLLAPETDSPTAPELPLEAETPATSPVVPTQQPPEPSYAVPLPVMATSLDSFSLEDASAGQVQFASVTAEPPPADIANSGFMAEAPATESAAPESAPEAVSAELAPLEVPSFDLLEEAREAERTALESSPEAVSAEISPPDATREAVQSVPPAEVAAPKPAIDWGLIYSVVHKVVLRMSPPPLPVEAVEEMARRLADEIATEIASESSPPQV